MAILQPSKILCVIFPSVALLPDLRRLDKGKESFNSSCPIHLFTDDVFDLPDGTESKGQVGIDTGSQLSNHAGTKHQLMTGNFRLRGILSQGRKQILRISHVDLSSTRIRKDLESLIFIPI
jgi:hypothetical protein